MPCGAGGILINKTKEEVCSLIEQIPLNNRQWSNERSSSKKGRRKFDVDSLTLLTAKIDVMV